MAVSNEDIFAWFSLGDVVAKGKPPSRPMSSVSRATLARHEKEKQEEPLDSYYSNLQEIELRHREIDQEEIDELEMDKERILNLIGSQDDFECVVPTHTSVFDPYDFNTDTNPKLPILDKKQFIISTIESNAVTVIQGSTGSGKSTQVPQYILETYARERRYCNIICTQPRRIAAMSVAKFVAEKRNWRLGSLVGYQIAMDKLISEDTRLTFVTTGVLLQKLIKMQNMNQYTHIILDERPLTVNGMSMVHERDKDTDFCLLLVKTFLRTNSRNVKVVLMSATLESELFAKYFGEIIRLPTMKKKIPAPVINIDATVHEVVEFKLDSILKIEGIGSCDVPDENDPRISQNTYQLACNLIKHFNQLEGEENNKTRIEQREEKFMRGTVLIFLPGLPEILILHNLLNKSDIQNLTIVPLHSSISNIEQQKVFLSPEQGKRKIILATNIAESSITVPDIKYVVDFCRVKELILDRITNYQSLKLRWASKASLTQRKGRAGRVSDGRYYSLIDEHLYIGLNNFSDPEIKRVPLESLVLHAKQLNIDTPKKVLARALEPPDLEGIEKAVINLKEVGALTLMLNGKTDPHDGDLTQFGEILATLPVDIRVGKLLILGHVFGILEDCLVIAACLSVKPLFSQPYYDESMLSYKSKMSWAEYSSSDCIAMLNGYKEWLRRKNNREFRNSERLEREWCERNFIKKNVIREVSELISEFAVRLRSFNITAVSHSSDKYNRRNERNILILKLIIAGAFYPNYFRWGVVDEEQATRDMSGHDPLTTVMISGLPDDPHQYLHDIAHLFKDCGEGKCIHFENSRAYLEFQRPHSSRGCDYVHGVADAVYIALKKRHGKNPLSIVTGDYIDATASKAKSQRNSVIPPPRTPKRGIHPVIVTEVDTPGHFWVQYWNEDCATDLKELMDKIRSATLCPLFNRLRPDEIQGQFCLALYNVDRMYYRGYVTSVNGNIAEVFFVDYGNKERVPLEFVCILPPSLRDLEMQAFECYLVGVKPAFNKTGVERWTKKDKEQFMKLVLDKELFLEVYSEVCSTLRVVLTDTSGNEDININESLIAKGMAVRSEEGLQSKQAHDTLGKYQSPTQLPSNLRHDMSLMLISPSVPVTLQRRNGRKHILKGPINPYEVSFQSITRAGGLRSAKIESDSVNSIVIDSEPHDMHDKLMVASYISVGSSGNVLLARNTTLLPNIHGLAHIVCMIFAPTIELRTDELKRQYTGALCGLGSCPDTGMPLFSDHDIEMIFDSLITQNDIAEINSVRHAINLTFSNESEWGKPAMQKIQEKARQHILDVILKPRHGVVPTPIVHVGWNQVSPNDIVIPAVVSISKDGFPPLLPLHNSIAISNEIIKSDKPAERVLLLNRIEAMEKKSFKSSEPQTLFCDLCRIYLASPNNLRLHIDTLKHQRLKKHLKLELTSADSTENNTS